MKGGGRVYIVPRTGLAQTCKRTETLQKPPNGKQLEQTQNWQVALISCVSQYTLGERIRTCTQMQS